MEVVIEFECMTLENASFIRISAISKWDFECQFYEILLNFPSMSQVGSFHMMLIAFPLFL